MKEENDKSKKLQTVERALDVLYLFHKYNGITLSFVAEEMNMSTTVAVSYTHLDVYKRQDLLCNPFNNAVQNTHRSCLLSSGINVMPINLPTDHPQRRGRYRT